MKTLLVVEDEKAIRMGICAMARRAPVDIETVLDCQNGVEALDILQTCAVDAMITDIRMPKMDGIELVRQAQALPSPPLTVVVSGYDDFSYAVSMFRQGVRDYILKPVERGRVYEILAQLDRELTQGDRAREDAHGALCHLLRSLMLGDAPVTAQTRSMIARLEPHFFDRARTAVCLCPTADIPGGGDGYVLADMGGHTILLAAADALPALRQGALKPYCAGISAEANDAPQLRRVYREAVQARMHAFVRGNTEEYVTLPDIPDAATGEDHFHQLLRLIGAGDAKEAGQALEQLLFLAQNRRMSPRAFTDGIMQLPDRILSGYGFILDDKTELEMLKNIWQWDSAYAYVNAFRAVLDRLLSGREPQGERGIRGKIQRALVYVQENFRQDINMATASNHVSMNYTQFSHLFKKYMGQNFIEYLKNMRVEEGRRLLEQTGLGIRTVSKSCGFKNEKHFMKVFKQLTGVSPSDYRVAVKIRQQETPQAHA